MDLKNLKHEMPVTFRTLEGRAKGKICINEGNIYLCSNEVEREGVHPNYTLEFKYAWQIASKGMSIGYYDLVDSIQADSINKGKFSIY